jgi:hypothetical protein
MIALGFVILETLTQKALDEISETWTKTMEAGYFNGVWE